MLSLNQSDGLGQRRPLPSDQPLVEFTQQSLLRSTQVLDLLADGFAYSPPLLAAVAPDCAPVAGVGTSEDPLVEAAAPDDSMCAEEGETKSSHFIVNEGHLEGEPRSESAEISDIITVE